MKNPAKSGRLGFTLVEMMVVVAIISVVATASVSAIRGAQRQARAVKCQANLNSLFKAVSAFRADHQCYPPAASYECYDERSGTFYKHRGWVSWVRSGTVRSRRNDSGNAYSSLNGTYENCGRTSKAGSYCYVGTGYASADYSGAGGNAKSGYTNIKDSRVYRSIDEGALFVYADKNFSAFCCEDFKNLYGKHCMRSYAMNAIFGSRANPASPLKWDTPGNANRLAMFVELGNAKETSKTLGNSLKNNVGSTAGVAGDTSAPADIFGDDSSWDWGKRVKKGNSWAWDETSGHNIGTMHFKSGKCYGHVMFADGHIESLELPKTASDQKEQRRNLGSGEYGD